MFVCTYICTTAASSLMRLRVSGLPSTSTGHVDGASDIKKTAHEISRRRRKRYQEDESKDQGRLDQSNVMATFKKYGLGKGGKFWHNIIACPRYYTVHSCCKLVMHYLKDHFIKHHLVFIGKTFKQSYIKQKKRVARMIVKPKHRRNKHMLLRANPTRASSLHFMINSH